MGVNEPRRQGRGQRTAHRSWLCRLQYTQQPFTTNTTTVYSSQHSQLLYYHSRMQRGNALGHVCVCLSCLGSPLPSTRQHPSYGDCLEVKREYYQNCSVLDCVTQCSQSAAHLCEQLLQVQQIGFVTLGPLHCA